jgi:hypothetical protein
MATLTAEQILAQLERLIREFSPLAIRAFLKGLAQLADQINVGELTKAIERHDVEGAAVLAISTGALASALRELRTAMRSSVIRSAHRYGRDIPGRRLPQPQGGGVLKVEFDVLDKRLVTAVQKFEQDLVEATGKTLQDGVRAVIEDGLRRGINPREIARGLREFVGVSPNQAEYVANLRAELEGGDYRQALTRELRDRRHDKVLRRLAARDEALTPAQIDRMVAAYERRLIGQHAETVARTVAINSAKIGKQAVWQQAVEQGIVNGDDLIRVWLTCLDDRVRPTHEVMHGATIGLDEQWNVPEVGLVDYPGQYEFNCRCVEIFRVRIHRSAA